MHGAQNSEAQTNPSFAAALRRRELQEADPEEKVRKQTRLQLAEAEKEIELAVQRHTDLTAKKLAISDGVENIQRLISEMPTDTEPTGAMRVSSGLEEDVERRGEEGHRVRPHDDPDVEPFGATQRRIVVRR